MKTHGAHAHEDMLLDFAYGELPPSEARAVEQHVAGCARCTETLAGIRGVRGALARLPMEPAPEAGLESLLAYAQQSARRAAAGPAPAPRWWRRWLLPAAGLATVTFIGVVSYQTRDAVDFSPQPPAQAVKAEETKTLAPQGEPVAVAPATTPPAAVAEAPAGESADKESRKYDAVEKPAEVATASPPPPPMATKPAVAQAEAKPKDVAQRAVSQTSKAALEVARNDWANAGAGAGYVGGKRGGDADDEFDSLLSGTKGGRSKAGGLSKVAPSKKSVRMEEAPAAAPAPTADEEKEDRYASVPESQVPRTVPDRSSLRLGGSTSGVGRGDVSSIGSVAGGVSGPLKGGAPEGAVEPSKVQTARPPSDRDFLDRKQSVSRPSVAELSSQAEEAARAGDRAREASLLRLALAAGAEGRARLNLLDRLCDAEFALGRREAAIDACNRVIREDPDSGAARVARRRLERQADTSLESAAPDAAKDAAVETKK